MIQANTFQLPKLYAVYTKHMTEYFVEHHNYVPFKALLEDQLSL